jgi:hypothetical protein
VVPTASHVLTEKQLVVLTLISVAVGVSKPLIVSSYTESFGLWVTQGIVVWS